MTTENQFPALNGEVVTEAHTAICREKDHATHTIAGEPTGICPRCGESTNPSKVVQARVESINDDGYETIIGATVVVPATSNSRSQAWETLKSYADKYGWELDTTITGIEAHNHFTRYYFG